MVEVAGTKALLRARYIYTWADGCRSRLSGGGVSDGILGS
jgi:hypothetical protein